MNELYQLELMKESERSHKECMLCNVILDSNTGKIRGFANRMTQVSFDSRIYISGIFNQRLNQLSLLEVEKGLSKRLILYLFTDIDLVGEYRIFSHEYGFMIKPTGKVKIKITKIKDMENKIETEIIRFLSAIEVQKREKIKRIGEINIDEIEANLAYYNFFL